MRPETATDFIEGIVLDADKYVVLFTDLVDGNDPFRPDGHLAVVIAVEGEAVIADGLHARASQYHSQVTAGLTEHTGDVSAHASCSDHRYTTAVYICCFHE